MIAALAITFGAVLAGLLLCDLRDALAFPPRPDALDCGCGDHAEGLRALDATMSFHDAEKY